MANQILLTVIGVPNFAMSFSTDEVRLAQSSGTTQANSILYIDENTSFPILQSIADISTLAGSAMIQATIMPQNIAALFPSSSKIVGVTRGNNGINSYIQFKNQTFYLSQTQGSLVTAANSGGGGGGSSLFPTTGTGTATGDVTGDLSGHILHVAQGGNDFLTIDPTVGVEDVNLQAFNSTGGGNIGSLSGGVTDVSAAFTIDASFNSDAKFASIEGFADATTSTLTYTADTHQFAGVINLPVQSAPASPNDGDIWREDNTNTGLKIRINGVTKTIVVS